MSIYKLYIISLAIYSIKSDHCCCKYDAATNKVSSCEKAGETGCTTDTSNPTVFLHTVDETLCSYANNEDFDNSTHIKN